MARPRPADRLPQLVAAATKVFIESGGFQRTQIGDIARAMGVAKGTVYLYVESKEALFDLVMRHALGERPAPLRLPWPTPPPGATLALVAERVREGSRFPALQAAVETERAGDVGAELTGVLDEIYGVLAANRTAIKLVGASVHDLPELAEIWFIEGRGRVNRRLTDYLSLRASRGQLRPLPDPAVAAHMVTESLTWFAVQRHWDPAPETMDDELARRTVIAVLTGGLLGNR